MSQQPVRVAVVGYGWWGKIITSTLAGSAWLQVAKVVEPDAAPRAAALADAAAAQGAGPAPVVTADFNDAIADPQIEAVILTTPHRFHAEQIKAAARAGKHVFCEKPLCTTFADASDAIAATRSAGVVLGIGHERRFEPAVIELRRRIAAGDLGTVLQIEANFDQDKFLALPPDNWRLSKELAPVGPLSGTGIHLVDLSIAILGPAESVWARLSTRGTQFANGDTLGIYGSQGWIEIRDRTHPEHPTGWDVTTCLRGQERTTVFMPPHPAVRANLEAFAQAVRGVADYPVTQREMLANVAAFEAVTRSAESRQIENIAQPQ